jgi:hypothetical protein
VGTWWGGIKVSWVLGRWAHGVFGAATLCTLGVVVSLHIVVGVSDVGTWCPLGVVVSFYTVLWVSDVQTFAAAVMASAAAQCAAYRGGALMAMLLVR